MDASSRFDILLRSRRLRRAIGLFAPAAMAAALILDSASAHAAAQGYRLVGWNNLGMHCMDSDYSLMSLLPPYNTIQAQLVDGSGNLVASPGGITVTYEAVADPSGSRNSTSVAKTNFWDFEDDLFGVSLTPDVGLAGTKMPGEANVPQAMTFDAATYTFVAEGIPITPYDDDGEHNTYPMMRLVARDAGNAVVAQTDIVLPVSDEMTCIACHGSGTSSQAEPPLGWINDPDPERDWRLNTLLLHDAREWARPRFQASLAEAGYNAAGLYATAVTDGRSVLCATCHSSEALPGSGLPDIIALTHAIHGRMALANDPVTGMALGAVDNRSGCYRCHPGSQTRCLRGAMGAAVAGDGTMAMQCQSCHGSMFDLADSDRTGWLDEPRCDSCHTGTAAHNNGQIRYTSVFGAGGEVRTAVDDTFATNDDTPALGLSLYRFSRGHGGLHCSACHGSTHAEFPSSHGNDNVQSLAAQGHVGMMADCKTCHPANLQSIRGGPHGMHTIGSLWVSGHGGAAEEGGAAACRACHGMDYRGTVLSRALGDRTLSTDFGTKHFWRGFQIGCYTCHDGPSDEDASDNHAAVAVSASAPAVSPTPVDIELAASDADGDGLALRVVSQPQHGTVGLAGTTARYFPDGSYAGDDTFTFAAWDGSTDSNLATVTVAVECIPGCETEDGCALDCPMCGDADGSGELTATDALAALRTAVGLGDCAIRICDVNDSGTVTTTDALALLKVAVGQDIELVC